MLYSSILLVNHLEFSTFKSLIHKLSVCLNTGTSAGASALSQYIDALSDFQISKAFRSAMPMDVPGFAPYPDFLAFGMQILITCK